jgi:hypothetical protein
MDKEELLMSKVDLDAIMDIAKNLYSYKPFPVYLESCEKLGKKDVAIQEEHQRIICLIEATVQHLNGRKALVKLPKFNYKDNKFQEE